MFTVILKTDKFSELKYSATVTVESFDVADMLVRSMHGNVFKVKGSPRCSFGEVLNEDGKRVFSLGWE